MKEMLNHTAQLFAPQILARLSETLREALASTFDELRQHAKAAYVKDWIVKALPGSNAAHCAVLLNPRLHTVSVMLLAADHSALYSSSGRRLACTFSARTMDDELTELFTAAGTELIVMPLNQP